jgi:hypothetical protein
MAEHWIKGAIKHKGSLHRTLGVPEGEKIPAKKLAKAAHSKNPKTARRARLAETLKGLNHSSHHHGNPGFPSHEKAGQSPPSASYAAEPHKPNMHSSAPHCFSGTKKSGMYRMSGASGAHRIGKR